MNLTPMDQEIMFYLMELPAIFKLGLFAMIVVGIAYLIIPNNIEEGEKNE